MRISDWSSDVCSSDLLGVYVQDQIRFFDRVSVVLGARRDRVTGSSGQKDNATTFRAGIIGEIGAGFSPFFSYTESFLPVAGSVQGEIGRAHVWTTVTNAPSVCRLQLDKKNTKITKK